MTSSRRTKNYRILITAGPTREPIDPVRFISNHSTGMLGYLLAAMAKSRGHAVTLVSGPTQLETPRGVKRVSVETASEMEHAVSKIFPKVDALVMSAAVADFRPIRVATRKIKRSGVAGSLRLWQLELVENPDIVAKTARQKKQTQAIVGFALETERLLPNARLKLKSKNLDAIVATRLSPRGKGRGPFGSDPVEGAILDQAGHAELFRTISKKRLAARILNVVEKILAHRMKQSAR